jgi:UDP:flavonoid glycosyltransferase YjiC (YdhE family)
MRVLMASTAGSGHFQPLLPFLEALKRRGDDILLVVPPSLVSTVQGLEVDFRLGGEAPSDETAAILARIATAPRYEASILGNRELFGRLCTAAMLPAMEEAFVTWRPELVVREPCEYSSAVMAERHRVGHVQVAISLAGVEAGSIEIAVPALEQHLADPAARLLATPYLTRFPAMFDPSPFTLTFRYRESPIGRRSPLPDWWTGATDPLVYVTFGTVTGHTPVGHDVFRTALDAVAGLRCRVLLTVGHSADIEGLVPLPTNVHVEKWVPQDDVFAEARLVVCHGGSGTTLGALAAGLPLVVVPLFADQFANGMLVAEAGAGVLVPPLDMGVGNAVPGGRPVIRLSDAPRIRAAISEVLGDPSYGRAATRMGREIRSAPTAGDLVENLISDEGLFSRQRQAGP